MSRLSIALSMVLMLVLAACGGASSATTAPDDGVEAPADAGDNGADPGDAGGDGGDLAGYDLCDAISEDEVSEITGADVTDSTSASGSGVLSCNYMVGTTAIAAGTTLATSASAVDPQAVFDANEAAEGTEEISGLGDGAVMTGSEDFPILIVMVNGNLYSLSVLADNLDAQGKRDATIELAELSVDRLP